MPSGLERMLAPVVVNPDTVSKSASKKLGISRLKKKGLPTDTAEYYRGAATEDEIDFAVHYQNRKLTYYFEHSKLKKWVDLRREQKLQKKLQEQKTREAAASVSIDVTEQMPEQELPAQIADSDNEVQAQDTEITKQ